MTASVAASSAARADRCATAGHAGAHKIAVAKAPPRSPSEGAAQVVGKVGPFPRKCPARLRLATEMAIGRGRRVYRLVEAEVRTDAAGRQIHQLLQHTCELGFVNIRLGIDIK